MSLTKTSRKIQSKTGNQIHRLYFSEAVAGALRREFGDHLEAIREVSSLTGANERAVRNWFEAKNGPNGEFLIALCRHSEEVLSTVLTLAGRTQQLRTVQLDRGIRLLDEARQAILEALA